MTEVWFYISDGVVSGPVTTADLASVVNGGSLRSSDLTWREENARNQNSAKFVIANILEDSLQADHERLLSINVQGHLSGAGISTGVWSDQSAAYQEAVQWSLIAVATQAVRDQPGNRYPISFLASCYFDLEEAIRRSMRNRQSQNLEFKSV
jgi:hypothetical protein